MSKAPWPDYLFDIGNVILFFDYARFARAIEKDCAWSAEELLRILDEDRHRMEAQALGVDEFLELAFRQIEYRGKREDFVRSWQEIFTPNEPMVEFIHRLADAGHWLGLLSNTNHLHVDYFLREYPVFERFHGHVFSHEVGCAKPQAAIYELAIRELGLEPERTVYLDDLEANVAAGEAHGFLAFQYTGQSVAEFDPAVLRSKVNP